MRRLFSLVLLVGVFLVAGQARPETQAAMSGDARIYANAWSKYQYTGWNFNGSKVYDSLSIWERFRLKTDFTANESLKFRLGLRVDDGPGHSPWGHGTFAVDNPAPVLEVYQAYMQFKWPGSDVQFTVGYQDFDLPLSTGWLGANPVMGGTTITAAIVAIPVVPDVFTAKAGFSRLLDSNKDFDPATTQQADELDAYFLTLPVTLDGFSATPWGMAAVSGRDGNYFNTTLGNGPNSNETLATNLLSAGNFIAATPSRNAKNVYWWAGGALTLTGLGPFKFYADVIYGSGNESGRKSNRRRGLFFDAAAEYAAFDLLTPQLSFWYATGEAKSLANGSERLPCVVDYWGPSNSFLFNSGQEFNYGFMGVNPVGSWGLVAALDKISFLPDLTHRLAFSYARGTNSPAGLRSANLAAGVGNYVQIGRDLTDKESVLAVNLDTKYNIYENLAAILETGWSRGHFQTSVWTSSFTHQTRSGDAWKAALGLRYQF